MATTNQNNSMKISTIAKELKMKSGKELIEKLKGLGFEDIKSTQSNITEEAFNALFESLRETYTAGIDIDDYLSGKAVIAEFAAEKAKPVKKTEKKKEETE